MHIQGESIMNDGSAAVFYQIFSARFLYETGIHGLGDDSGWVDGFVKFLRLAIGGACIGIAFGGGLLVILLSLSRRLAGEDKTVQVVATITIAYLAFFISEVLAKCSGIIAVFSCAVTVKAFGETLYNDSELSHHFWSISGYLLNTLLFSLAGLVWGHNVLLSLVSATDLKCLLALFVFLVAIRFFLVFIFYPLTANIGIGTNWQEAVFMSYSGLRGGVGIALALSLHAGILCK
jgi:NhaP-type Na+/H+ or K+/H+ antiporter